MSLLKGFPEIREFFNQKVITEEELNEFKNDIKLKYQNIAIQKSAFSLIKLHLIKFENRIVSEKNVDNHTNNHKSNSGEEKMKLVVDYESNDIESIGKILDINPGLIVRILKQNNFEKSKEEFLSRKEYEILEDFFKSKLKAQKRKKFQISKALKSRRKKVSRSLNRNNYTVYDKIKNQNGIGKVIYIRKK